MNAAIAVAAIRRIVLERHEEPDMTTSLNDAKMRARAIARWEGEGGALAPLHGSDAIDPASLRILTRLEATGDHERMRDAPSWFPQEHRDER
jgi:hypothetical protein